MGGFSLLLHSNLSKGQAFTYNPISSLTTLPCALNSWSWLTEVRHAIPYVLAISTANFIYIADLVPRCFARQA